MKYAGDGIGAGFLVLYQLLGISRLSTCTHIHQIFLKIARRILLALERLNRSDGENLLQTLSKICIAHDILTDPVTRADYDFRNLSLANEYTQELVNADCQKTGVQASSAAKIGELLHTAGVIDQAELDIACDMHKAVPEMRLGTFLVRQGIIRIDDLEAALAGQKLLQSGTISMEQFQQGIELSYLHGLPLLQILYELGYLNEAEMIRTAGEPDIQPGKVDKAASNKSKAGKKTRKRRARS